MNTWPPFGSLPVWVLPMLLVLVLGMALALGLLLRSMARARQARTGASAVAGLLSGDRVALVATQPLTRGEIGGKVELVG